MTYENECYHNNLRPIRHADVPENTVCTRQRQRLVRLRCRRQYVPRLFSRLVCERHRALSSEGGESDPKTSENADTRVEQLLSRVARCACEETHRPSVPRAHACNHHGDRPAQVFARIRAIASWFHECSL